jgi:hypothetical protein
LTEKEGDVFDMCNSEVDDEYILAKHFCTRKVVSAEAVARKFRPLWRATKGFMAKDKGDNIMLFYFRDLANLERVLTNEPWSYDNHLVQMQRVDSDLSIEHMEFSKVSLWVQVHGNPIRRMKIGLVEAIGSALGKVEPIQENKEDCGWGQYARIRVWLDSSKPLCRGERSG